MVLDSQRIGLQFDQAGLLGLPGTQRFSLSEPGFDIPDCSPELLAIAQRGWEDRLRSEYVGVMVMRRFHGLLVDLNAPMDLQEVGIMLTLHEQQHTRLCAAAAQAIGSDLHLGFDLAELQQARTHEPLEEQLWMMIIGTLICGEGVALELLKQSLTELPRTGFCEVLRSIARDEVLHASLGFKLLVETRNSTTGWLTYPGDDWVKGLVTQQLGAMRLRDVVEADEAAFFETPDQADQMRQLGIPNSQDFVGAYHRAIDTVIPAKLKQAGVDLSG